MWQLTQYGKGIPFPPLAEKEYLLDLAAIVPAQDLAPHTLDASLVVLPSSQQILHLLVFAGKERGNAAMKKWESLTWTFR